ncbi:hypothetical protein AMATHDRAFT_139711 [Amanita thiersii Skay4041]|uniref:Far11/STRP C-terminal domain-containing protein n=1 Tax=Amanita thiersii Skay4041 TaxID=703135 RepID=A0A2A9NQ17_9AGAR|nr:hypothetical protein AMATHDRAFT_139711 [Amanita thiersii Skay4041]
MSFAQIPNFFTGASSDLPPSGSSQPAGLDSITLGQLKSLVGSGPKPKQSWFDFKYDDEDTMLNEIEEFYSYVEMPQAAENLRAWAGSFPNEWTKATPAQRRAHIEILLESLEHRNTEIRFTNARRLFYVLQGTFAETVSPEHQLHWIFENAKIVRSANGVSCIVEAIKIASHKHDMLCGLSDQDAAQLGVSATDKADLLEEIITEVSVYLGMLYHLVEVFKGHEDFADELMSLDPPLPVYLFNVVAGLRDKSTKGYPIKKLLLVLWKTLLACWGGIREHARVKKLARELAGLQIFSEGDPDKIKSTPLDIESFRRETSIKYPTFIAPPPPPPPDDLPANTNLSKFTSKLAEAYSPIPIRHHYHHDEDHDANAISQNQVPGNPFLQQNMNAPPFQQVPQSATPAPSPSPSPKPKKQQYQTDQSRPFLFPFSRTNPFFVPFAVEEADNLYNKHMYVSLALVQTWKTREDCMIAESGLNHLPGSEGEYKFSTFNAKAKFDPENAEPLPDMTLIEQKITEAIKMMTEPQSGSDKRKGKERKEDLMRLKRVEQIYSAVLPVLSGWVLVLLKLLLATVSANTGIQPQSSTASSFPPDFVVHEQPPQPPPTLDEIDVTRHREITSKAVSAILLLTLKWFKVSHIMKFHQLGQHLLDTNCLLLILKMFGLQEVATSVVSKADSSENNFFQYCLKNFSKNPQQARQEDNMPRPSRQTVIKTTVRPNGEKHEEEIEQVTEYSWRNFFSAINFARIMQKLSKGRSHRIGMLVQYRSSAVLKRVLRVNHPMLQLQILKLIKSQVPFCGRKWRQSNMKVITSIYLNCRPDLRDEWLTGIEVEDPADAQSQEQALRHLVKFYNTQRYGPAVASSQHGAMHRRSGSMSHHIEGLHPGPELSALIHPVGTPNIVEADVFPPSRSQAPDPSIFLPYITEDIAFEEEYEEYLLGLGWSEEHTTELPSIGGTSAWHRLPEFVSEMTDGISDSESIVSFGDLGDVSRLDSNRDEKDSIDENLNNWEHMSPKTMAALPKSPAGRRSSSGGGLRPVLPFGLDDGTAVEDIDEELTELGPMPREPSSPFASGAGVDEVEYAYG